MCVRSDSVGSLDFLALYSVCCSFGDRQGNKESDKQTTAESNVLLSGDTVESKSNLQWKHKQDPVELDIC